MTLREGQLVFDFTGSVAAEKWDVPGTPVPETMRKVDFVVEEEDRFLFVEVKDISDTRTTESARAGFIDKLKSGPLVNENLVPKCRDTWAYLHLMNRDSKPIVYVVLFSAYEHTEKPDFFAGLLEKLRKRLAKEGKQPWKRRYSQDCAVANMRQWNRRFQYRVWRDPVL